MSTLLIQFNVFSKGNSTTCEGRNDANEFAGIRSAMKVLLFEEREILSILCILAALLHMGNISFKGVVISMFFSFLVFMNRPDCVPLQILVG